MLLLICTEKYIEKKGTSKSGKAPKLYMECCLLHYG